MGQTVEQNDLPLRLSQGGGRPGTAAPPVTDIDMPLPDSSTIRYLDYKTYGNNNIMVRDDYISLSRVVEDNLKAQCRGVLI